MAGGFEVWGGIECTLNRVGAQFHSQLERNGHFDRIEGDLEAFASLGISAIRYPVLWELVEVEHGLLDFTDADRALNELDAGAIRPVLGLVHHGSGPRWTSLVDEEFPRLLAEYARAVAHRYPWVTDYTPVNEPLTTARFAGLYGIWYPHGHDDRTFVRALLNEARGTILAMRAIRDVNPAARLIQTEDLGQAGGTPPLADQVRYENDRRWLSFDLVAGRVSPQHRLYEWLVDAGGADAEELRWLVDNACPPDVIGINHYRRSNRWLDHRLALFDPALHGGNGLLRYADVAASDTPLAVQPHLTGLMEQAWRRYETPVALTEVHIYGDAFEQSAWWAYAIDSASGAQDEGAEVCAVTSWSLLGSFDWDTLCTSSGPRLFYEPGAFDVSSGRRVETALASVIRESAWERSETTVGR
jgi:dTDP-4-dehydrorhamnose reductase